MEGIPQGGMAWMASQVLSNPEHLFILWFPGLRSISDLLCDWAKPLSFSGSQFPHPYNGGISLLRILSRSSLENKGYDKTAYRIALCYERSQPCSPVGMPTLCAVRRRLPFSLGRDTERGHPYSQSTVEIRETCSVGHKSGKC